ncbi:MAG: efflux RND transporter permease subunit [Bacteroidales bacterium]|nr:efflux RND transporter permease subunit [Bacteroidales bacterium]
MAGLAFIPKLSVRLSPSSFLPSVSIVSYWQNASPVAMEQEVTSRLEGALGLIEGVERISSVTGRGKSDITLDIDRFTDIDIVRLEAASAIRLLYPSLPDGVTYPQTILNRPGEEEEKPLITFSLNGPSLPWLIQKFALDHIKKPLIQIDGVGKAEVYGAAPLEWQIVYKTNALRALGIRPSEIATALENYFEKRQAGYAYIRQGDGKLFASLETGQDPLKPALWGNIPVKRAGSRIIRLSDIASVSLQEQEPSAYFRINGLNTVNIVVYAEKGANSLVVAKRVKKTTGKLVQDLPAGYQLMTEYDSTGYIAGELEKISGRSFFTVAILLLFVLLASLSFRYLFVILLSLFTNISICFALYYLCGIDIHLYSLAGITISLGLIIDNTIVMADHIIHQGNRRVFLALTASTLTTVAALAFILFLPEEIKLDLMDFAIIIIINLAVSLAIALFFIPSLLVYVNIRKGNTGKRYRRLRIASRLSSIYGNLVVLLLRYRRAVVVLAILAFGLPVFLLPSHLPSGKWYADIFNKTLGSEWYNENARPVVNKVLGGSLRLFVYYVYEGSYYTKPEKTALYVWASLPKGASIQQMDDVFKNLEAYLVHFKEIEKFITRVYSPQNAGMTIYFRNLYEESSFPYILKSRLIARSLDLGGVNWNIYGVGKGFSNQTGGSEMVNYKVAMFGYNHDELFRQAEKLREKLLKHPRIQEVNISGWKYWWEKEKSYEYFLETDREQAMARNLPPETMAEALLSTNAAGGITVNVSTGNEILQARIIPEGESSMDVWNTFNTPVGNQDLKIGSLTSISKGIAAPAIYKEDQNYLRIVDFNYLGNFKFGDRFLDNKLEEMQTIMPLGYYAKKVNMGFHSGEEAPLQSGLVALLMAIIFIICAVLFESLKQPLAIILVIPLSFTGIFLAFYLTGFNFDQGGYASFLLLSGLTVNSAIYLVNEFNNVKMSKAGKRLSPVGLYIKSFNHKVLPVVLTVVSTILGLVPFLVNGQNEPFWFALALGSVGGLTFSLVIIVFVLPVFILPKNTGNSGIL